MSEKPDNLIPAAAREPPRLSDAPAVLYWAGPVIVFSMIVVVALSVGLRQRHHWMAQVAWVVVFAAVVGQSLYLRRWDREQSRRRLAALESLIKLSTLMGTAGVSEEQVLRELPRAVGVLLGLRMTCIALVEEDGKTVRYVGSNNIEPTLDGERFPLAELPMARKCIETKYVVAVSDVRHSPMPTNATLDRRLGVRSVLEMPIIYQDKVLGVMVLADARPRTISPMDERRAWLWGCQAGVMLSNARLYSGMHQSVGIQKKLMEDRDTLYRLNTEVQRPGTLDQILQRIVDQAPGPLEMDGAWVWLITEDNPDEMVMAAATDSIRPGIIGYRHPIPASKAEVVFATRKPDIVEDVDADLVVSRHLRKFLPGGSLAFEPLLRSDGQPLGVLVLMRHKKGKFDPEKLELAQMFSSRAAVAIERAQLYHQASRDAQAKAMLLRELNHRVKNNLASIVSLLSLNQPELPWQARQWLKRVTERIGAMAQMHELFSDGRVRVRLEELVDQIIRSLSVARPAGVAVQTDLDSGGACLRTDRAVSLAMAIHELCFNAIIHGMGQSGTLMIRARRENGQLMIEVEDHAASVRPKPAYTSKTGIGLSLVRGLVSRELSGRFNLSSAGEGSVATVSFPLLNDEMRAGAL